MVCAGERKRTEKQARIAGLLHGSELWRGTRVGYDVRDKIRPHLFVTLTHTIMAAQTTLTVSYALSPPEGTNAPPSLAQNGAHTFAVEAERAGNTGEYYEALRKAIAVTRERVGEQLTAWRDAVGSAEAGKEKAAKAARAEEEEEDEEQEY